MYICICNPFSDKDVSKYLNAQDNSVRVKDVYTACTGGEEMNCGTCACELKKMVEQHNNTITMSPLQDGNKF